MKHKVLILGTLGEVTELVRKAKARGYETIVCDGYPDGIAREYADKDYTIPVTDIDAIAQMCREESVDGIITSFSDLLLECMTKIADKAGLPCYLKPEQLPWYRDKSACREVLEKLGLPTPGFRKISVDLLRQGTEAQLQESIAGLEYPLISKPLDKYGSRGIFIIHDQSEIRRKALQTAEYTNCQEILIEEYNDGYEFNMMTWVMDGRVNVVSIADREKTEVEEGMLPISTRNVYPSRFLTEVEKGATDVLQRYIGYTGQTEGALSMQFFWKPGKGIQVCEIAGRFFGYEHELTDMVASIPIWSALFLSMVSLVRPLQKLPPPITIPICRPSSAIVLICFATSITVASSNPVFFSPARASPLNFNNTRFINNCLLKLNLSQITEVDDTCLKEADITSPLLLHWYSYFTIFRQQFHYHFHQLW